MRSMSAPCCMAWFIARGFSKPARPGMGRVRPLFTLEMRAAGFAVRQPRNHPPFTLPGYAARMNSRQSRGLLLAVVFAFAAGLVWAEDAASLLPASLNSAQIVEQMRRQSQAQTAALKQYKALRHYAVEYRGFSARIAAKMDVDVNYDAANGKSLRIVSQSGSRLLCEKVLKRAVDSEEEAYKDKASTALTEANYRFQLAGSESVAGRTAYILNVQPLTDSKFLFRGKIWVDAADFAVAKMETEPAKSPSFWISRTLIHYVSVKTDSFWLPQQVRSETKVRVGGTAMLTIDYGSYAVVPAAGFQGAGR